MGGSRQANCPALPEHYILVRMCILWRVLELSLMKGGPMFIVAAVIGILLLILLAVSELFIEQYNADELSKMGIDHK